MRTFSARTCNRTVTYLAASWPTGARGNAKPTYGDSGPSLKATVQPATFNMRSAGDGNVLSVSGMNVYLRDDPSALNGGLGIRERDKFTDGAAEYVVVNSPQNPGESGACWLAECLQVE